jgi:hypothetical protein
MRDGLPRTKDRLFAFSERLPLIGRAADPFVAAALGLVVVLTLVFVAIPGQVFPEDHNARGHILQLAGGLIVVGGAYFAAVNLRSTRASQLADRLRATLGDLGSDSEAVRVGAIQLLEGMANEDPNLPKDTAGRAAVQAQRRAIYAALAAMVEEGGAASAEAARHALSRLDGAR